MNRKAVIFGIRGHKLSRNEKSFFKKIIMRKWYFIVVLLSLALAQDDQAIQFEDLFERGGLIFAPGQDSSFNGNVIGAWPSGIDKINYSYKNGKPDSKWSQWYDNGQPKEEVEYSSGIKNGIHKQWYKNGQQKFERSYEEGVHNGSWTEWYENGQLKHQSLNHLIMILDQKTQENVWKHWTSDVKNWDEFGYEIE
jgi:antitoxin component YwqK of YwqJK toxin-antitoxin module